MNIQFYLPFPPSINNYYVKTAKGVFISKKGVLFRHHTAESVIQQVPSVHITQKVCIDIILFPPDKRKRDLDNYVKPLQDALTKSSLWTDDSLVDQIRVYRGSVVKSSGATFISINEAGPIIPYGQEDIVNVT